MQDWDGGIFGVDLIGNLYRINATTAVSSLVAHLFDFSPDGHINPTLAGDGKNLYFTYGASSIAATPHASTLYRINPNSGVATTIGITGVEQDGFTDFQGTGFINGSLYGFTGSIADDGTVGPGNTYRLNLSTGAATLVGPYNAEGRVIFGAIDTPEPTSFSMIALGALALGLIRRGK